MIGWEKQLKREKDVKKSIRRKKMRNTTNYSLFGIEEETGYDNYII